MILCPRGSCETNLLYTVKEVNILLNWILFPLQHSLGATCYESFRQCHQKPFTCEMFDSECQAQSQLSIRCLTDVLLSQWSFCTSDSLLRYFTVQITLGNFLLTVCVLKMCMLDIGSVMFHVGTPVHGYSN